MLQTRSVSSMSFAFTNACFTPYAFCVYKIHIMFRSKFFIQCFSSDVLLFLFSSAWMVLVSFNFNFILELERGLGFLNG